MSPPAILQLLLICLTFFSTPIISDDSVTVYQALAAYDFPVGLLPKGVTNYDLDTTTGQFTVYLAQTCEFTIDGYDLRYKTKVTGVISKDTLSNLSGVQAKVLFFWLNIGEVTRDNEELEFSVGIISAGFPIDSFYESPECGCGFDCNNNSGWWWSGWVGGRKCGSNFDSRLSVSSSSS